MSPADWVVTVGGVLGIAGIITMAWPRYATISTLLSSVGLTLIGLAVVVDSFHIFSVIIAGLCFLMALLLILGEAARVRKEKASG